MRRLFTVAYLCPLLFFAFASYAGAQKCVLKVGVWESFPEEKTKDGGSLLMRKAKVTGFTSTSTNQKSRRLYKGVSLMGYAYYENIPEGQYKITVRKAGFKTTIQSHKFTCDYARDGFDFLDILVFRGSPKEVVEKNAVKEMRLNRITRLGSPDSDTGERVEPNTNAKDTSSTTYPKTVSGGVLNGKGISLPKPPYPPAARAVRASGAVSVQVLIDEDGNVISANAVSGHPLLREAAESAARGAKFPPTLLSGQPVKVSGVITYNFVP